MLFLLTIRPRPVLPFHVVRPAQHTSSQTLSSLSAAEDSSLKTLYTIDCPPTKEDALQQVVSKHCLTLHKFIHAKPVAAHTKQAFRKIQEIIPPNATIVLDSGCGTGRSTQYIGSQVPVDHSCWVLGIDRSMVRLERNKGYRNQQQEGNNNIHDENEMVWTDRDSLHSNISNTDSNNNVVWIRAELVDFWRLMLEHQDTHPWNLETHYLLYPNPYPKTKRLKSRWYAHPSFPLLLQLGGDIVIRSNWEIYLEEFAQAVLIADQVWTDEIAGNGSINSNDARPYVQAASQGPKRRQVKDNHAGWSNFERKMDKAGEPTFELLLTRSF